MDVAGICALRACGPQVDASLAFKLTTHFALFGGTLLKLGSTPQQRILREINTGNTSGCFALAEVGFGCVTAHVVSCATIGGRCCLFSLRRGPCAPFLRGCVV